LLRLSLICRVSARPSIDTNEAVRATLFWLYASLQLNKTAAGADRAAKVFLREGAMPFYEKGDVRIRYEEAGSGFPLFLVPGGGLNSRISNWPNAVFNSMEIFKDEFRCITMDQRNANGGESTGPIPAGNPWDAFADDQLGLMDYLGVKQFLFVGYCIGGCFAGKLMERAPNRVLGAVFCQTVGHRPEDPTVMYRHSSDNWVPGFRKRFPECVDRYNRKIPARPICGSARLPS
jgi:pimeloyl-ACP methyl ester carboxylesterase